MNDGALQTDTLISERYRILQKIGEGGMAVVYRVEQIFLHEILALKVLTSTVSEVSSARFQKEAQVCRLLEHPNLIKVLDFAVLPDGSPYLVLEFINGETLSQRLSAVGAIPESEALDIFIQVMEGLEYAHSQGIVHRDLKPSNIMLKRNAQTKQNQVKILDFGIAKMTNKDALNVMDLTRTGEIFGSPLYMSPEQCLGKTVGLRSDLYSAGCALFHALTGAPPFTGDTALATFLMHQQDEASSLKEASLGRDFSPAIEQITAKLLAKSPADRYQTAAEVGDDLKALKARRGTQIGTKKAPRKSQNSAGAKFSLPVSPAVLILSIICILLAGALFYVLYGPQSAVNTHISETPQIPLPESTADTSVPAAPTETKAAAPVVYYAPRSIKEFRGGRWQFNFPKEEIARVALADRAGDPENAGKDSHAAAGTIYFREARPLYLAVYMDHNFMPADFLKFRDDEIGQLRLIEWRVQNDVIPLLKRFKNLDSLELFRCSSLTNDCLKSISEIPNLKSLGIKEHNIDVYKLGGRLGLIEMVPLGQMVAKSHIEALSMCNMLDMDKLVHALLPSRNLEKLTFISAPDLSAKGLADIARIKSMKTLIIEDAKNVTDEALTKLVGMKNLHYLRLQSCAVTPASIPTFKKLPSGCVIDVDSLKWSTKDKIAFENACPGHKVR